MRSGVLFVTSHPEDAHRLSQILDPLRVDLDFVEDLEHLRDRLGREQYPVILTDADLPDGTWPDVLDMAREMAPGCEVIVTHRFADARLWTEALDRGAYDLLPQPFHEPEVRRIVHNACSLSARTMAG